MIIKNLTLVIFCFLSVNSFAQDFDADVEYTLIQQQIKTIDSLYDVPKNSWIKLRKQAMNMRSNSSTRVKTKKVVRIRHSNGNIYVLAKYKTGKKAKLKVLYLDGEIQFLKGQTRFWIQNQKEETLVTKRTKISRTSEKELLIYQKETRMINDRNVNVKYQGKIKN